MRLVAECEWGNFERIIEDFEKLLQARAGFRLMIFTGSNQANSEEIAERLADRVREFKGSRAEDAWLLAAWEGSSDDWSFRYFTIEMNAAIPVVPVERSADSQEQMEGVVTESLFTSETLEKPPGTGKPNPLVEILFSPEPPPISARHRTSRAPFRLTGHRPGSHR